MKNRIFVCIILAALLIITGCNKPGANSEKTKPASGMGETGPTQVQDSGPVPQAGEHLGTAEVGGLEGQQPPGSGTVNASANIEPLREILKGIVMKDSSVVSAHLTGDLAGKADEVIKAFDFSKLADGENKEGLWEKMQPISSVSITNLPDGSGVGLWQVSLSEKGGKDLMAQIHYTVVDGVLMVDSYQLSIVK